MIPEFKPIGLRSRAVVEFKIMGEPLQITILTIIMQIIIIFFFIICLSSSVNPIVIQIYI